MNIMEDSSQTITEELLGPEENTKYVLELIVNNGTAPKPVGTIKMQFHLNEAKMFQTDYKTCLFCDSPCKTIIDVKKHMLLHSKTLFTCDLFDLRFFLKWNVELTKSTEGPDEAVNSEESNSINYIGIGPLIFDEGDSCETPVPHEITSSGAPSSNAGIGGFQACRNLSTSTKFSCKLCDFQTSNSVVYRDHKRVIHAPKRNVCVKTKKIHSCDQCEFKTPTWSSYNRHMILTHYPMMHQYCKQCKLELNNGPDYYAHLKTHKEKQHFQCDVCGKVFNFKQNMIGHMHNMHNGIKPYRCDVCDYKTAYHTTLKLHKRIHTKEKPYLCEQCDYRAARPESLKLHMRSHTGVNLVQCTMCKFKCKDNYKLKTHMRTHTGEKPYSCEFCSYKCSLSGNLHTHVRGVHGQSRSDRVFCANCIFRCYLKSTLVNHMKKHSAVNNSKRNCQI